MAKVAGGSLLSLETYVAKTYGADAFERVLGEMPPALAEPLRGIPMPVAWYPTESFIRAIDVAARMFDPAAFYEKYGAFAAEFEISAFQKVVLRFTSPAFFLDRAGRIWHRFHDSGEWEVEGSAKSLRGTLRNFDVVNGDYCRVLTAWIARASELTGVTGTVHHTKCRARGDDACVFEGGWA